MRMMLMVFAMTHLVQGESDIHSLQKLNANDAEPGDEFGNSVAIDHNTLVIGARFEGDIQNAGAAYVFERTNDEWNEKGKLEATDREEGDRFGSAVSASGDFIVVGAHQHGNSGAAYIFGRNQGGIDNWGQVKKLTASDVSKGAEFGHAVSISGNRVVIGARQDDAKTGSVYIFERVDDDDDWELEKTLKANGGAEQDQFGTSVSIDDETIVVGAFKDDAPVTNSGSAYIFQKKDGAWEQVVKLTVDGGGEDDQFGTSVSIAGDMIVIGATGRFSSGSAFIFSRNQGGIDNWGQVTELVANEKTEEALFGGSVAISGDIVGVGAHGDEERSGAVYIFARNQGGIDNWGEVKKITAREDANDATAAEGDLFGGSISISSNKVLIGANNNIRVGSAHLFSLPPTASPTESPTESPTVSPTVSPTESPTVSPTESPTASPTESPTKSPTESPTESPTPKPTSSPTPSPTLPTLSPTSSPTFTRFGITLRFDAAEFDPSVHLSSDFFNEMKRLLAETHGRTGVEIVKIREGSVIVEAELPGPVIDQQEWITKFSNLISSDDKFDLGIPQIVNLEGTLNPTLSPTASPANSPESTSPTISPESASPTISPTISEKTISPTTSPESSPPTSSPTDSLDPPPSLGLIIGIVLGAVTVVGAVTFLLVLRNRKKHESKSESVEFKGSKEANNYDNNDSTKESIPVSTRDSAPSSKQPLMKQCSFAEIQDTQMLVKATLEQVQGLIQSILALENNCNNNNNNNNDDSLASSLQILKSLFEKELPPIIDRQTGEFLLDELDSILNDIGNKLSLLLVEFGQIDSLETLRTIEVADGNNLLLSLRTLEIEALDSLEQLQSSLTKHNENLSTTYNINSLKNSIDLKYCKLLQNQLGRVNTFPSIGSTSIGSSTSSQSIEELIAMKSQSSIEEQILNTDVSASDIETAKIDVTALLEKYGEALFRNSKQRVDLTIPFEDLEIQGSIGRGGFGVVAKALWKSKDMPVALKTLQGTLSVPVMMEFVAEINRWKALNHENIVQLIGSSIYPRTNQPCFLMELMDMSLHDYLYKSNREAEDMNLAQVCKIALATARGLEYLHKNMIIHKDVKPQNVLLKNGLETIKLCDFGMSTAKTESVSTALGSMAQTAGTPAYMAPEILEGTSSFKVDIFSFGIMLGEITEREKPFHRCTPYQISFKIREGQRPSLTKSKQKYPPWLLILIETCWSQDRKDRPSPTAIINTISSSTSSELTTSSELAII